MVRQTSNRHIQAFRNNLKFISLDYLAAKKSGILYWRRDFCDWSLSSHSILKVMPFRHLTEYNTLRDKALHTHIQHWSIDWNRGAAACLERFYVQSDVLWPCVAEMSTDQDWSEFWPDQDWIGLQFFWKSADQDWIGLRKFCCSYVQGRSQTFSFGGTLEGPVLQQGELSIVCVGLSEKDLLQWHDVTRKILGGPGKI